MVLADQHVDSDLDGDESGGFVVVNVEAAPPHPYQVLQYGESDGYFQTLQEARDACRRLREESGNEEIYVYALVGVRDALNLHPRSYDA